MSRRSRPTAAGASSRARPDVPYPDGVPRQLRVGAGRGRSRWPTVEAELTRLHAAAVAQFRAQLSASRGRAGRLSRPHDPAPPGRAPHLADRRRGAAGAARRRGCRRRFPQRRCRGGRAGRAAGAALPRRAGRRSAEAGRSAQSRRRRQRDLDRPGPEQDEILAFDTGPGNALIDDWVRQPHRASRRFRRRAGSRRPGLGSARRRAFWQHPYFDGAPPKSLDRDDFRDAIPHGLSLADGAATLTEMTAAAVAAATAPFPEPAARMAGRAAAAATTRR